MWAIPIPIFLILSIFFAGRLGKEISDLGINDITPSIVSPVGIYHYVVEKKKRGEKLSFNFWASIFSVLMIFSPFIYIGIAYYKR